MIMGNRFQRGSTGGFVFFTMLLLMMNTQQAVEAQGFTYLRGQTVSPIYEGWEKNSDGSYTLWFGYINRNWEERPNVPISADNSFSPGLADRGQPTHFLPRLNRYVFSVQVPADFFESNEELVWTLRTQGETERAYATLHRDYIVDYLVIMNQQGALGGGSYPPEYVDNAPPVVKVAGDDVRQVRVGEPLMLVTHVTDDGLPYATDRRLPLTEEGRLDLARALRRPDRHTMHKVTGLTFSWFVYRGEGAAVRFDPDQAKVWRDIRPFASTYSEVGVLPNIPDDNLWVARAIFSKPGTYVLRGRGEDGGLATNYDLTVHVNP